MVNDSTFRFHVPNGILIGSAVSGGRAHSREQLTDRQTYSNNKPHLVPRITMQTAIGQLRSIGQHVVDVGSMDIVRYVVIW